VLGFQLSVTAGQRSLASSDRQLKTDG